MPETHHYGDRGRSMKMLPLYLYICGAAFSGLLVGAFVGFKAGKYAERLWWQPRMDALVNEMKKRGVLR